MSDSHDIEFEIKIDEKIKMSLIFFEKKINKTNKIISKKVY